MRRRPRVSLQKVRFQRWLPQEQIVPGEDVEYSATLEAVCYAHNKLDVLKAEVPVSTDSGHADDPDRYHLV
jgi:sulfate permease, SulP family